MANAAASGRSTLRESGIDGLALKPTEIDLAALADGGLDGLSGDALDDALPETLVVDFEGHDAVPDASVLEALAETVEILRVTTPVRADGFDPLASDDTDATDPRIPDAATRVLVAGHPAYLEDHERRRAIGPRLRAAVEQCAGEGTDEPWVGTEGIERLALAVGGTQFELLSPTVERDVRALRAVGFDGAIAVYAPTVLASDEDAILDAVGDYVARRGAVAESLPDGAATDANGTDTNANDANATDANAAGEARSVLSAAAREYALVGDRPTVRERTDALREAGVDHVVGYPAAGLTSLLG